MTTNNANSSTTTGAKYAAAVNRARREASDTRRANLNLVSNAARKAYPAAKSINEAIAIYSGLDFGALRSYRQCAELGYTPAEIHSMPTCDVWGSNSDDYCSQTGAPKFFPRAAFEVPELTSFFKKQAAKVDGVNGAGIAAPAEYTAPDHNPLTTPTEAAEAFAGALAEATAPAAAPKTSRRRITRAKKTAAPVVMAADDLPF